MAERDNTEVIVVGAGPVGLWLASELRLQGVDVLLAERLEAPMTESRASQLNARTMELLDQHGLRERLGELPREARGHFGGLPIDVGGVPSQYAGNWKIPQYRTEAVLGHWAQKLGVVTRRGYQLHGLCTDADGVTAEFHTPRGPVRRRARYLIGCDGETSTVRGLAGFELVGAEATRELLRADIDGIQVRDRRFERLEHGLAVARRDEHGTTRVMVHESGKPPMTRAEPPGFAEIVASWAKITGEDISGGTPVWVDSFNNTTQQATEYRRGRVLLCGDAAHLQPPVGGQALNLGLQDAANLGWKLAASVRGSAPDGLLGSYHTERHPVGERVLAYVAAQAMLLFGGPEVDSMRIVLGELLQLTEVVDAIAAMLSGLDVRYPGESNTHPLIGARMPNVGLDTDDGPTSTVTMLRSGGGVLIDLTTGTALAELIAPYSPRVRHVRARVPKRTPTSLARWPPEAGNAALLRPDGHIAWVGADAGELESALRRWFVGVPR